MPEKVSVRNVQSEAKDTTMIFFNMRFPRWEHERLKDAAKKDHRSASSFVRKAVADQIARMG